MSLCMSLSPNFVLFVQTTWHKLLCLAGDMWISISFIIIIVFSGAVDNAHQHMHDVI